LSISINSEINSKNDKVYNKKWTNNFYQFQI
jgi:hypothetical protein